MEDLTRISNEDLLNKYANMIIRVNNVSVFMNGLDTVRDANLYLNKLEEELLRRLNNKDK